MTECTHCRKRYDDHVRFCPVDGFAVAPVEKAREPWVGRLLMGQFQIESVCGNGATGTVYRAVQAGMERAVAVKVLRADLLKDPDVVRRFVREARAGAKLNHQNIATVHMVGQTDDGVPFLVMEYVEGLSLASIVAVGKPLPLARIVHIGTQIASALSEAHSQGIVHRDLKPENILLTERRGESDVVKVVDFGIAKMLVHAVPGEDPISRMGTVFGTPHYIAPEQASGQPVDGRADIYSLGCILYQMATGHVPFAGQAGLQVLLSQVRDPVPDPRRLNPRLSEPLAALILSMLAKAPADRPQTAEAVAVSLQQVPLARVPESRAAGRAPIPVESAAPSSASDGGDDDDRDEDREAERERAAFFGPQGSPPRSGREPTRRAVPSSGPRGRASGRRNSEAERAARPPSRGREEPADERDAAESSDGESSDRYPRVPARPLRRYERSRHRDAAPEPFLRRHWVPLVGVGGAVTVGLLAGILYAQWTSRTPAAPVPPPAVSVAPPPPVAPVRSSTASRSAVPLVKPSAPAAKKASAEPTEARPPELTLPSVPALTGARIVPPLAAAAPAPLAAPAPQAAAPPAALAAAPPPAPTAAPPPAAVAAAPPPPPAAAPPPPPATPPAAPAASSPAADKPAPPPDKAADKPAPADKPPDKPVDKPAAAEDSEEPSSDPYNRLK